MDLSTAIKHAIDGNAVLFLGSGASFGSKPIEGDSFLTGRELAIKLSEFAEITPLSEDLNFASQRYRKVFGDTKLIELLQKLFSVSEVTDSHRRISEIKWHGIYTTNYDNVLERAFADRKKKLVPITPDQDTSDYTSQKNTILHINGYIDKLNSESLSSNFKLTNTSYLTEAFAKSNWAFVFRRSLETARAIIFIGYSMYDIDIQRILFGGDSLKEKTIFIERNGKTKKEIESSVQIDFGEVYPIGLDGFWGEYDRVAENYEPADLSTTFFAFDEIIPDPISQPLRDDDVFSMLLSGVMRKDIVWNAVTGNETPPYYVFRGQLRIALEAIEDGARNIIAVSDLANGKTSFCMGAACRLASESFRVFWLKDEVDETADEIERLCSIQGKIALIVENYSRRLDELRHIQSRRNGDLVLILSAKSSIHEVYQTDLTEILDPERSLEIDLNIIDNDDLPGVEAILDTYKLWGERDALPQRKKSRFIREDCGQQLSGVLLDIIKSPEIQRRFNGLFESFRGNSEVADIVVAASVLKLLGLNTPKESVISEVLDSNYLYSLDFKRNPVSRELLSFSSGGVVPRSSILAKYGLITFADSRQLVDRLIKIATNCHDRGSSSDFYFGIYKDLVTFSMLQSMLPEKGKRDSLIRFYEGVKNLRAAKNHPHFWLQYAIARLASDRPEDLRMAKLFLDSAYANAEKRENYHTRHLDNVLARYWIQHSMTVGDITSAMLEFADGHALLVKQARTEANESPYKVARLYLSFYNAKRQSLTLLHRDLMKKMSETVLELASRLPERVQAHPTVRYCRADLQSLIADASIK